MNRRIKVGLKYCGHCNPRLNGPEVIQAIQARTEEFCFTGWDDPQNEILLIIDACPSACATRPQFAGPVVSLDGLLQQGEGENIYSWAAEQLLVKLRKSVKLT